MALTNASLLADLGVTGQQGEYTANEEDEAERTECEKAMVGEDP